MFDQIPTNSERRAAIEAANREAEKTRWSGLTEEQKQKERNRYVLQGILILVGGIAVNVLLNYWDAESVYVLVTPIVWGGALIVRGLTR